MEGKVRPEHVETFTYYINCWCRPNRPRVEACTIRKLKPKKKIKKLDPAQLLERMPPPSRRAQSCLVLTRYYSTNRQKTSSWPFDQERTTNSRHGPISLGLVLLKMFTCFHDGFSSDATTGAPHRQLCPPEPRGVASCSPVFFFRVGRSQTMARQASSGRQPRRTR